MSKRKQRPKRERRAEGPRRFNIKANFEGPQVSRPSWRLYQAVLGLMREEDNPNIHANDGFIIKRSKLAPSELRCAQIELKDAGFLTMQQSNRGCSYSYPLNPPEKAEQLEQPNESIAI